MDGGRESNAARKRIESSFRLIHDAKNIIFRNMTHDAFACNIFPYKVSIFTGFYLTYATFWIVSESNPRKPFFIQIHDAKNRKEKS